MDIQKHLERAQESVKKKNFDYAIALYNQILSLKPDFGQARAELRHALSKRSDYKSSSPLLRRITALPQLCSVFILKLLKNMEGTGRACERYLQIDPKSLLVNRILGGALERAGHLNSAVAVYEFVSELDREDTESIKKAGYIKYRNKDITGALELYERALAINPRDAEAEKMRKNLAAEGTLASGSYSSARSSRELIKEKDEAAHLQRQTRIHRTAKEIEEEIGHLKKTLEKKPDDKRTLKQLGELYTRKKDFSSAREVYEGMLKKEPGSFDIRCLIGDIDIWSYSEEIDKIEKRLKNEQNVSLEAELDDLRKEMLEKQINEYSWRVKMHPTDLGLWYEYGRCVFRGGDVDEAIKAFQHAIKDPRHKISSLHLLGKSFLMKGLYDLAEKQLKAALDAVGGVSEKSKAVCYDLGKVCEKKEGKQDALDWYMKIYEIDINYRDVAVKIDELKVK